MSEESEPNSESREEPPASRSWLPSGAGVGLDPRPSSSRQLGLTVLGGLGLSAFMAGQFWFRHLATTPPGLLLTFLVTLAVLAMIWLAVLGFRTLDRRRLIRRFPGTLVFSFRNTSDVTNALRKLNAFEPGREFDFGSIESVADAQGLTLWQRNPPELYGSLRWAEIDGLRIEQYQRQTSARYESTVEIDARSGESSAKIFIFGADASILPLPTRREVAWVHEQLEKLYRAARPV